MADADQRAGEGDSAPRRRLRADARRNRERLIAAAAVAFKETGADASLEAIARDAGVGIGTLYRHFPTREALIEAVYRQELEGLVSAAETLSASRPPDEALAEWMQRFVGYIAAKRGLKDSLHLLMESNSPLFAEVSGLLPRTFKGLVDRAVAAGAIRSDADSADLLHTLFSFYAASDSPDWQDRSRRMAALMMDGLRYGAPGGEGPPEARR